MSEPASHDFFDDTQLARLAECRQGDVVHLDRQVWLAHGGCPATAYSRDHASGDGIQGMYERASLGAAVLTQTCDIIPRPSRHRPFVAVAPLVELDTNDAREASRGRRPRYACLPSYLGGRYFTDLDRISTIETGLLLVCGWTPGLDTDSERLAFARAVARKFSRFAFPDDLPKAMSRWRDEVVSRHDKESSPEGALYRKAIDVRVAAAGDNWDDVPIDVKVTVLFPPGFLPPSDPDARPVVAEVDSVGAMDAGQIAAKLCQGGSSQATGHLMCERLERLWSDRCNPVGSVRSVEFELLGTDDLTVDAYLATYPFDLEFLTSDSLP